MNELTTIFSAGMDQMLTFAIGACAGIMGLALSIRAIEYAKDMIALSDDDINYYSDDYSEWDGIDGAYYDRLWNSELKDSYEAGEISYEEYQDSLVSVRDSDETFEAAYYDSDGDYAYDDSKEWDSEPLRQSLNK